SESCSTNAKTPSASADDALRTSMSVLEVAAVVLIRPTDNCDDRERRTDEGDPDTHGEAEQQQRGRTGKNDGPPAPGAEVSEFRVTVVDVCVEAILGQLTALRLVRLADIEG